MTPSRRLPALLALLCMAFAAPYPSLAGGDPISATRWLEQSDQAAVTLQPVGVYASYALTRVRLAQARAYALLGDIENTRARLPYAGNAPPEWSSGGDGVVRMLMVSLDLDEIHASLLTKLAAAGRTDDAYEYVAGLNAAQGVDTAYIQLGTALANAGQSRVRPPSGLADMQNAMLNAGMARGLLEANRPDAARETITAIEPETNRVQAVVMVARRLIAEQEFATVARLLELGVLPARETAVFARYAVNFTLLAGDMKIAAELTSLVEEEGIRDGLDAMLALTLAGSDQQSRAAEIFAASRLHQAPTWEQVAARLNKDDWLEKHYLAIESPWRRTERLYQYARRKLDEGETRAANRIAKLAAESAEDIPAGPTRWLACEMLAGYHAKAADPEAATAWAARIPVDTPDARRHQSKASAAVVEAWARAGDTDRALSEADNIDDSIARAAGLTAAAAATFEKNNNAYRRLVTTARQSLHSVGVDQRRQRQDGWAKLVTMQCRVGDLRGAMETAARIMQAGKVTARTTQAGEGALHMTQGDEEGEHATQAGESAAAYEAIVSFTLQAGDFVAAEKAARSMPAGVDPSPVPDHRAQVLAQVTEALAAKGEGRKAAVLLEEIEQKHVRELATPVVAGALIAQGEQTRAIELAMALSRDDVREEAMAVVLRALAEQGALPDAARLMTKVPDRNGGELCWASAAASGADPEQLDQWLDAIEQPACNAFANAGAAYAQLAAPEDLKPADLFARLDPAKAEDRMAEAMQKSAARQPMR